jgi:acyl-CoA synthetase (NDP forming)
MGGESDLPPANRLKILDAGLPLFRSPERALAAVASLMRYARAVRDAEDRTAPAPPFPAGVEVPAAPNEHQSKEVLSKVGLRVPQGEVAADLGHASSVAARIGYPVVLKVSSSMIGHKSDVGGVAFAADESQLEAAYARILADVASARPDITIDGILVEKALGQGIEMIVSAHRDSVWGEFTVVGLGGVWAELLNDSVVISAFADRGEVKSALSSLRGYEALVGARGGEPSDIEALVDAVMNLGGLLRSVPTIVEVEVNPLLVFAEGGGAVVLDAVVVTSP